MSIHSVSYDLKAPGRNYDALYDLLKSVPAWCRVTESHWLLDSDETATGLRDKIAAVIDDNDVVMVTTVRTPTHAAWRNLDTGQSAWIKKRL